MARQLTAPGFIRGDLGAAGGEYISHWYDYFWVYVFAAAVGFATTIAEPALIAVAIRASEVSGGALRPFALRVAVAIGVALGVALGTLRIVTVRSTVATGSPIPARFDRGLSR